MAVPTFATLWRVAPGEAPVKPGEISVDVGPHWNRPPASESVESAIIEAWEARQAANPNVVLFNGTKFRLAGVVGAASNARVTLALGVTDYRTLCATNFAADPERPPCDPDTGAPMIEPSMSAACGVEALVVTSSDDVILFRRSDRVAENPGWYCCPGGHPEPSAALSRLHASEKGQTATAADSMAKAFPASAATGFARCVDDDAGEAAGDNAKADASATLCDALATVLSVGPDAASPNAAVIQELFKAPEDEVVEELGVPADKVTCEGLCGVVVASNNAWKPDLVFRVRVSMTTAEVLAAFDSGEAREAFESQGKLLVVPLAKLRESGGVAPCTDGVQITPPSLACLQLAL